VTAHLQHKSRRFCPKRENMPNTIDSDEETSPKPMDTSESPKPDEAHAPKSKKKGSSEKTPLEPFFYKNSDGSFKSYVYQPEMLKYVAALTIHEMDRKDEHEKMVSDNIQSVKDQMRLENKKEKDINEFIQSRKGDDPNFKDYESKILMDPNVPREMLEQIASGQTSIHSSLANAIECMHGNVENRPFACDSISEIGAKKRAKNSHTPIACLAYEGNKQKVTTGEIDKWFGINKNTSETNDTSSPPKDKTEKTLVENLVHDLDAETRKSGYAMKVALYEREMQRAASGELRAMINDSKCTLEEMVKFIYEDDKNLNARPTTNPKKRAVDVLDEAKEKLKAEKEKEKAEKEKETAEKEKVKAALHVQKTCESIRKEVTKKYCEVNESKVKKAAVWKASRENGKKPIDEIDEKTLEQSMNEIRKEMKSKLLTPTSTKIEILGKELLVAKVRKTNLKNSKIVCPTSHDVYTPITNKSPCGRVMMHPQHAKLIQKKKTVVMNKYASHATKMRKKGLCIKIWA